MSKILCESVQKGLRDSEALAIFKDYHGRTHYLRVERDFLDTEGDKSFLPIGVVGVDYKTKAVLIELPHEAETGANRLWVKQEQMDHPVGEYV